MGRLCKDEERPLGRQSTKVTIKQLYIISNQSQQEKNLRRYLISYLRVVEVNSGIINGEVARKRASWFSGTNPCGEILLSAAGSFCNLCEIDLSKFNGRWKQLKTVATLLQEQTIGKLAPI